MAILLPVFNKTSCRILTVCGCMKDDEHPIAGLLPEGDPHVRPFHVTVEPYEDEYRASFVDANLSAFGETRAEAVWALKDIIAATFEMLNDLGEKKLGPGPVRQFRVLREFIRKP